MKAHIIESAPPTHTRVEVDPITLDLIENGLVNAREQMDAILFRTAMSPIIREQRDGFPVITDRDGRLHAGQFGSPVSGFLALYDGTVEDGDVFLTSDPYACDGAISHANVDAPGVARAGAARIANAVTGRACRQRQRWLDLRRHEPVSLLEIVGSSRRDCRIEVAPWVAPSKNGRGRQRIAGRPDI